ncbi:O-antigen ligase family protein [Marinobacter adhaerens]|uniref:O-antigen ligase family protein n=1 Tax=Marinobacter adhaerens TaxID=1033846 RepID=UPI001E512379|nr:O-antigen ligase family protein [Marinobacter adhaerens]MCD1648028.1 O-antigen ligase family protein [Marinobacter adhaerens]
MVFKRREKPLNISGAFLLPTDRSHTASVLIFTLLLGFGLAPSLFLALIPQPLGIYPGQRFFGCYLFWLATCGCFAAISFSRASKVDLRPFLLSLPLLGLFALGDALWTQQYQVEPLLFIFFFAGSALLGGLLAKTRQDMSFVKGLQVSVVILSFFYGLIAFLNYGFGISDQRYSVDDYVIWGFLNIRYWSHLASWFFPIIALTSISNPFPSFRLLRVASFISGSIWWWILLSTAGRGSALGVGLSALLVLILFRRDAFPLMRAMVIHFFSGILLWIFFTVFLPWVLGGSVELRQVDAESSGRIPLWIEAWAMSLVNFPFGMGPQSWLTHDILNPEWRSALSFAHPHNMYLFWAAEYGWLSVVALLLMLAGGVSKLVGRFRRESLERDDSQRIVAITSAISAAFVHAGVSAVFIGPASLIAGFFIISAGWALGFSQDTIISKRAPYKRTVLLRCVFVLALCASIVVGVRWVQEVERYYEDNLIDRETYKGRGYAPRFWSHGDFPRQ